MSRKQSDCSQDRERYVEPRGAAGIAHAAGGGGGRYYAPHRQRLFGHDLRLIWGVIRPNGYEFGRMTIQQDGKTIVVGQDGSFDDFHVARLTSSGSPHNSFDGDGEKRVAFGNASETATAVAVDYNGSPGTNPFNYDGRARTMTRTSPNCCGN